jgi:hypothetical protein
MLAAGRSRRRDEISQRICVREDLGRSLQDVGAMSEPFERTLID